MRLTKKLLDYLHGVFDKAPVQELVLRVQYDGDSMLWKVEDGIYTTEPVNGSGLPLRIDLRDYNFQQLATFISAQPGYSIEYLNQDFLAVGARALLDESNSITTSNGDHMHAHTSVLWSYLEAIASELKIAADAIAQMLLQMSTRTASDVWLDELGKYYAVPRLDGEPDSAYGPRIIAEVLRPRGNNIAIALAIEAYTGEQAEVIDVTEYGPLLPIHDGSINHSGIALYNSTSKPRYGLFDVTYGYDLINGGSFDVFEQRVRDLVERVRDAGTHMRALILRAGGLNDKVDLPDDGKLAIALTPTLVDSAELPTEALLIPRALMSLREDGVIDGATGSSDVAYTFNYAHTGVRRYNGRITHSGGVVYPHGSLESEFSSGGDPTSIGPMAALHDIVNVTLPSVL